MRRFIYLVVFALISSSMLAAKPANLEQLRQLIAASKAKPDTDVAWRIGDLQLTERLGTAELTELQKDAPGEQSRQALKAIADESQFLEPSASEIENVPAPSIAEQKRILGLTVQYVGKTIPQLPNFFATRETTRFEDTPQVQNEGGYSIAYQPLHLVGSSHATVLYRDGQEVVDAGANKVKAQPMTPGLTTWGVFGPILGTVVVDAARSKLAWSHWERGDAGTEAVFSFEVPKANSHYEVNYCCVVRAGVTVVANLAPFREIAGYHGTLAIDAATGTIVRVVLTADLRPTDPVTKSAILVDYGAVEIGGRSYICPVRSISSTMAQTVTLDQEFKFALANQVQPLKVAVNDVVFDQYHLFKADSRVLTPEEAALAGNATEQEAAKTETAAKSETAQQEPVAAATAPTEPAAPGKEESARTAAPVAAVPAPAPEISTTAANGLPDIAVNAQAAVGAPGFTLRTTSRLVDVAVVAVDKKGRPVADLKAGDFEIYDNGRKQVVSSFSQAATGMASGASGAGGQAANAAEEPTFSNRATAAAGAGTTSSEGNTTVLLIDSSNVAFGDLTYARQEMQRFLKTVAADERVGLYVLKSTGFKILLEPTTDHAQIAATLSKWMPSAQELARAQDEETRNRQHIDWVAHTSDLAYVNGNEGNDAGDSIQQEVGAHGVDPKLRAKGSNPQRDALESLRAVSRHLAGIGGHKSLVWISSDNVLADWSSQATSREDKGSNFTDSIALQTREELNEAHVSIYPLDVSQLEAGVITADLENRLVQARLGSPADAPAPPPNPTGRYAAEMHQDTHPIQPAFQELAQATGGRSLRRVGDLAGEMNGIVDDGRAAYQLSFTPDAPADDKYHAVTVKAPGRKDVTLRYRNGYFYAKEPATLKERFTQAIWKPEDLTEIGLSAKADAKGGALKLTIAATDIAMAEQGDRWMDKIDIFTVARDDATTHAKVSGTTLALRLMAASYQKALREGLPVDLTAPLVAEGGALRVVVVDENTGRMGTVTIPAGAVKTEK